MCHYQFGKNGRLNTQFRMKIEIAIVYTDIPNIYNGAELNKYVLQC